MKTKDFAYWFIEELSKEDIEFQVNYISKDDSIKVSIAEYLKNIYYRFVSKGDKYEAGYNKYNEIVKTGVIQ